MRKFITFSIIFGVLVCIMFLLLRVSFKNTIRNFLKPFETELKFHAGYSLLREHCFNDYHNIPSKMRQLEFAINTMAPHSYNNTTNELVSSLVGFHGYFKENEKLLTMTNPFGGEVHKSEESIKIYNHIFSLQELVNQK